MDAQVCTERILCNGMRWPLLHAFPPPDIPEAERRHICPLCMWGYVLPPGPGDEDADADPAGHPLDFAAALPPEFYPNPFHGEPADGSGPRRAVSRRAPPPPRPRRQRPCPLTR